MAGSSRSAMRSESTWLPEVSPDTLAAANLINNFTCEFYIKSVVFRTAKYNGDLHAEYRENQI